MKWSVFKIMASKPNEILSAAEAARLWQLYGFASPQDLVLEDLALALGIAVLDDELDSCAARLIRKGNKGVIRISTSIREAGRRRFALSHEIGHFLLHERISQLLACTEEDIQQNYKNSAHEIEASVFAANLLMPEHLFKPKCQGVFPERKFVEQLANEFMTSMTATAVRVVELSNDYCLLVVSEKGRIKWWRASPAFEGKNLWLETKIELPRNSVAAGVFHGEPAPKRPEKTDLIAWLGEVPGVYSDVIVEDVIPLTQYGQVLSLLWLP